MVKLKYSALYTDNMGCEQADVYFSKDGFQLNVRDCIFENDDFDFDFYAKNTEEIKQLFYLKENELIEYCIDIKIPIVLSCNDKKTIKEFLLRVEKNKNYYNNSLSLFLDSGIYKVEGYDLQELLSKMKDTLPVDYSLDDSILSLFEAYYMEEYKDDSCDSIEKFYEKLNHSLEKKSYLSLIETENNTHYEKVEKIPVVYIRNKYCLS